LISIWPKSMAKTSVANIRAKHAEQAEQPVPGLVSGNQATDRLDVGGGRGERQGGHCQ
jgi:hypothetical protein